MWLYIVGFYVALPATVLAALTWGGRTERSVALLFAAAAVLSIVAREIETGTLFYVIRDEVGVAVVDTLLLAGLLFLAIRAPYWWLICEAALQLMTMTAHIARALDSPFTGLAYALMAGAGSYPSLLLLLTGLWQHRRRTRRA